MAALTEACQRGIYRVVHRRSARRQTVQSQLNVRQELAQARARAISLARAITRAAGLRVRSGRTEISLPPWSELEVHALRSGRSHACRCHLHTLLGIWPIHAPAHLCNRGQATEDAGHTVDG